MDFPSIRPLPHRVATLRWSLLLVALLSFTVACTPQLSKEMPASEQSSRQIDEVARLEQERQLLLARLDDRERSLTRLQLSMLARQAEINQLILAQENTIQEVVRAQAKLRSRNNRAESVASMAEATMLIKQAGEQATNGQQQALVERARQMLVMSHGVLAEENYDGAAFLASQAMSVVQPIKGMADSQGTGAVMNEREIAFAVPLGMRVLKHSNLRSQPSLTGSVLSQLQAGESVKAFGYSGEWLYIERSAGESGWIYYQLLGATRPE